MISRIFFRMVMLELVASVFCLRVITFRPTSIPTSQIVVAAPIWHCHRVGVWLLREYSKVVVVDWGDLAQSGEWVIDGLDWLSAGCHVSSVSSSSSLYMWPFLVGWKRRICCGQQWSSLFPVDCKFCDNCDILASLILCGQYVEMWYPKNELGCGAAVVQRLGATKKIASMVHHAAQWWGLCVLGLVVCWNRGKLALDFGVILCVFFDEKTTDWLFSRIGSLHVP
jgi:hypothetical protein